MLIVIRLKTRNILSYQYKEIYIKAQVLWFEMFVKESTIGEQNSVSTIFFLIWFSRLINKTLLALVHLQSNKLHALLV